VVDSKNDPGNGGTSYLVGALSKATNDFSLTEAETAGDVNEAHTLFEEYAAGVGISLCFQNFDQELANLPGDYASPSGRLLLARLEGEVAGCIALRKLDDKTCEMKRLYLRPEFRGKGLGAKMVHALLDEAKQIGYSKVRLDTLPGRMDEAIGLYRSIGFKEIPAYYDTPFGDTLYMELDLTSR
jgi:ribosomal protein S18 acetylase RimI-like enzyme